MCAPLNWQIMLKAKAKAKTKNIVSILIKIFYDGNQVTKENELRLKNIIIMSSASFILVEIFFIKSFNIIKYTKIY